MAEARRPIIIVKKVAHAGAHGGAWKVAYADFVTAMMALFIVLWLLSSSAKVQQAVSGYFRDPTGSGKNVGTNMDGTGRSVMTVKDDLSGLKEKLKSMIKLIPHFEEMKGNVEFTITEEGLRIDMIENAKGMFFESGKPNPSPVGVELLSALAKELGKMPNRLLIEGHSDATPYEQSAAYTNWELSADRANAARRLMVSSGLTQSQVAQVRGYADQDLRNKANPEDPSNRRVTVIVRYLATPKELKLAAMQNAVSETAQHHIVNPARIGIANPAKPPAPVKASAPTPAPAKAPAPVPAKTH
jgi:chemotaxis protein MotB